MYRFEKQGIIGGIPKRAKDLVFDLNVDLDMLCKKA